MVTEMPLPTSLQSYADCLDFFEKVVDDPKGGRVWMGTYSAANTFRLRCNQARQLHRKQNEKAYAEGMPLHGCSEYDPFQLRLKEDLDGEWWVYAERTRLDPGTVELLSEMDDLPEAGE
jgi:hypothetical protein